MENPRKRMIFWCKQFHEKWAHGFVEHFFKNIFAKLSNGNKKNDCKIKVSKKFTQIEKLLWMQLLCLNSLILDNVTLNKHLLVGTLHVILYLLKVILRSFWYINLSSRLQHINDWLAGSTLIIDLIPTKYFYH